MIEHAFASEDIRDGGVVLLVDKPLGWTSYQVVRKIRSLFNVRRVGHAGTLDPKATGLLIVCTGKKTKQVPLLMSLEKEYIGTLELGIRTASFDTETGVTERRGFSHITETMLREGAARMVGALRQRPPMYSALKVNGHPLYRYARRGEEVERAEREVLVREFAITASDLPRADFRVVCSKGTYVRSLVDDLGQQLGCGATLIALRRIRIGAFSVEESWTMERLTQLSGELGLAKQKAS